jgi:DNA-binding NarL/FixJ family response regulator
MSSGGTKSPGSGVEASISAHLYLRSPAAPGHACRELEPDVALVDLELEAETGFEVALQIAGRGSSQRPRVILISTYSEDDFEDMIADSPAISFLPKTGLSGAAIRTMLARAGGPVS